MLDNEYLIDKANKDEKYRLVCLTPRIVDHGEKKDFFPFIVIK